MTLESTFTNLHVHTEYSTLDGINKAKKIPRIVKEQGQVALALTDHGNCSGHWAFYNGCKEAGVKPILGMEAYYSVQPRTIRANDDLGKRYYHLILLALNNEGLHNLYKLTSESFTSGMYFKPRIDDELLSQYSSGLAATSACLGAATSQFILRGDHKAAGRMLDHHAAIFSGRFFVELQPHENNEQRIVNEILIQLAKERSLPLVVTADAHYTHSHDKHLHETTLKMATNYVPSDDDGFSFGDIDVHLANHAEMTAACERCGIPHEAVTNTHFVQSMVDADSYFSDRRNRYIRFKALPEGITAWQYLEALAFGGLNKRLPSAPDHYHARIRHELSVMKKLDMSDYMLCVWEFTKAAREMDVKVGPGRGSVAGSLVAYCLEITQLDPIEHGLMFERFINEGRAATPIIF